MVERDIYEVANQLGGYIDEATPAPLATFLRRESREAAKLAARIAELEAENARLTKNLYLTRNERDNLSDNVTRLESEALSRTGAVKVPAEASKEMVEAAQAKLRKLGWTYNSDHVRAALKAAMEAGRHE